MSPKGNHDSSITAYEAVTKISPKTDIAYQALAVIYNRLGKLDKSYEAIAKGLKENPGNPNLLYVKAGSLEADGKVDEAIKIYEDLHNRLPRR